MTNEERIELFKKIYLNGTEFTTALGANKIVTSDNITTNSAGIILAQDGKNCLLFRESDSKYATITKFSNKIVVEIKNQEQYDFVNNWSGMKSKLITKYYVGIKYIFPNNPSYGTKADTVIDYTTITFDEFLLVTNQKMATQDVTPEYVEFTSDGFSYYTMGKIYPLNNNGVCLSDTGKFIDSMRWPDDSRYLKPSTKEAYDAQNSSFVVPKDWYFEGTSESEAFQKKEFGSNTNVVLIKSWYYNHPGPTFKNRDWNAHDKRPSGTEITFEQFKKYIYEPSLALGNTIKEWVKGTWVVAIEDYGNFKTGSIAMIGRDAWNSFVDISKHVGYACLPFKRNLKWFATKKEAEDFALTLKKPNCVNNVDEFVLPEKWAVKLTQRVYDHLKCYGEVRGYHHSKPGVGGYGSNAWANHIAIGFTEITEEQYFKYVANKSSDAVEPKQVVNECPFKPGDRVRCKSDGEIDIVKKVPGMPEYDKNGFGDAASGMTLVKNSWVRHKHWELASDAFVYKEPEEGEYELDLAIEDISKINPVFINVPKI